MKLLNRDQVTVTMIRAYEEIVDFIAAGTTPASVSGFRPSEKTKDYVAELIRREKTTGLSPEETAELNHFLQIEHLALIANLATVRVCRYIF